MKKILCLFFLLSAIPYVWAQNNVFVKADPKLDSLVNKNLEINKGNQTLDGYRIQIFAGSDRNNAQAMRSKFITEFPDEQVYLIYQQPYFKLRVGDYRNLIEAQGMYKKLQKQFEQLLIVPDKINLPKL
ncbi:MAG: SPOR domain-containing protein [Bacteroidia bacterium]|nr:SPOR domain-containing protein [Bacteroidia bacterium]